jgi:hypothetical protein
MTPAQREALRQNISLLDYLRQHGWKPARRYRGQEVADPN